jgi:MinD-like ATPase involved in chromosome partitioning or flagellar assembly
MDVVVAAGGAAWEAAAIREIEASPHLRLVRRCVDVTDLLAVAHPDLAPVALVSADLAGLDADAVHRLERGGVRVAAVGADGERCRALGIATAVGLGSLDEVVREPLPEPSARGHGTGRLVAVWGPTGAPGRSTIALALASSAAAAGTDTVLVDADTYGGAQAQMLAILDDVSGLVAACRAANTGRTDEVLDHVLAVAPGLRLLTGLPRADMWTQVRAGALDLVLTRLRAAADLVVVDCGFALEDASGAGPSRNRTTVQVLEQADTVVVVGRADPVGLSRLVRGLHDLTDIPVPDPVVVVNMMRSSLGWREHEISAVVQRLTRAVPAAFVPFDQAHVDLALVSGRSPREVARGSALAAAVDALATRVVAPSAAASASP